MGASQSHEVPELFGSYRAAFPGAPLYYSVRPEDIHVGPPRPPPPDIVANLGTPSTERYARSAGYDASSTGGLSMEALVQLKTADAFMNLADLQAAKFRKVVQVANLRATETQGVLRYLQANGNHNPPGQLASGIGFGRQPDLEATVGDAPGPKCCKCAGGFTAWSGSGECRPCHGEVDQKLQAPPGCDPKEEGFKGPKECVASCKAALLMAGGAAGASGGSSEGEPKLAYDLDADDIMKGLKSVVAASRQAVRNSAQLANEVRRGTVAANSALRIAADELNYPGLPAETLPLPPPTRRPRVPRPHDLAPSGLDFLFSSTPGSDPYRLPTEGSFRRTPNDILPGREVHNPFGTPPLPKAQVLGAPRPAGAAESAGAATQA